MKTLLTKTSNTKFTGFSKKVFAFVLFISGCIISAHAQDSSVYKKFRIDFGIGAPGSAGKKLEGLEELSGIAYVEPNYAVHDNFAVGLRYAEVYAFNYDGKDVSDKNNNLFLATANFRTNGFNLTRWDYRNSSRIVAGIGIGMNNYHNRIDTTFFGLPFGEKVNKSATAFAFMTRLGYEAGKFTIGADYTYTGNKGANFIAFELGFYLGGGKKNK